MRIPPVNSVFLFALPPALSHTEIPSMATCTRWRRSSCPLPLFRWTGSRVAPGCLMSTSMGHMQWNHWGMPVKSMIICASPQSSSIRNPQLGPAVSPFQVPHQILMFNTFSKMSSSTGLDTGWSSLVEKGVQTPFSPHQTVPGKLFTSLQRG